MYTSVYSSAIIPFLQQIQISHEFSVAPPWKGALNLNILLISLTHGSSLPLLLRSSSVFSCEEVEVEVERVMRGLTQGIGKGDIEIVRSWEGRSVRTSWPSRAREAFPRDRGEI